MGKMDDKVLGFLDEMLKEARAERNQEKINKILFLKELFFKTIKLVDVIKVSGKCTIECFEDDNLKWIDDKIHNLVVITGLNHIADLLSDGGENAMSHMVAGSDNTAPAAGQTALLSQLGSEVALASTTQTGGNTVVYVCTFEPGEATGTWEEVAIINDDSALIMLDRLLTGTKVKAAAETFKVTITLTISAV